MRALHLHVKFEAKGRITAFKADYLDQINVSCGWTGSIFDIPPKLFGNNKHQGFEAL